MGSVGDNPHSGLLSALQYLRQQKMPTYDKNSKIGVLGAGAMGSFFGGLLAEKGLDVVLLDVWQEHVDNINNHGLRIVGVGGDRQVKVRASTSPSKESQVDIVFVQCKAAHTKEAILGAKNMFGKDTVFISFQNGLGNEELVMDLMGKASVLGGLTALFTTLADNIYPPGAGYYPNEDEEDQPSSVFTSDTGDYSEKHSHIVKNFSDRNHS